MSCGALEVCNVGTCASSCGLGQTGCLLDGGGYCATTSTDNANCGSCGTTCGVLQNCVGSMCKSACTMSQSACMPDGGQLLPDGAPYPPFCTDTSSDNANCGGCFNQCPYMKPLCVSGGCYALDAAPG